METQAPISRRNLLSDTGLALGAAVPLPTPNAGPLRAQHPAQAEPFGYCLNTSTIRGQNLPLVEKVAIAAEAGYQGIEPWISEIDQHVKEGGSLEDLRKRIRDAGLSVESAIGFAEWIVDDADRRARGLEEARRNMDLVRQIGGKRLAAPPAGATEQNDLELLRAAERYRRLLELGEEMGVVPQVEVWGFSRTLRRLGETVLVAVESQHPQACVLPDIYHLYKGGSDFLGLKLLNGAAMHVFHVNDYPAKPDRGEVTDAHRVYPGDGVAPLGEIFRTLRDIGFRGMLSLESFNRDYWNQDARTVARTGLEKVRTAVRQSLSEVPARK